MVADSTSSDGDVDDEMACVAEAWRRSRWARIPDPSPTLRLELHDPLGTKPEGPAGVRGAGEHWPHTPATG